MLAFHFQETSRLSTTPTLFDRSCFVRETDKGNGSASNIAAVRYYRCAVPRRETEVLFLVTAAVVAVEPIDVRAHLAL